MANRLISEEQLLELLRRYVRQYNTQILAAQSLGVRYTYLNDILRGNKKIGKKIARIMGYEEVKKYTKIE